MHYKTNVIFYFCSEQRKIREYCFMEPSWPPFPPVPPIFCCCQAVVWVRIRTFYKILCGQYWQSKSQSYSAHWSHGGPVGWNKMSFQLVIERMCAALLLLSEYLHQAPYGFRFSWELMVFAALIVVVISRRYIQRRKKKQPKDVLLRLKNIMNSLRRLDCLHKPMKPACHLQKKPVL